MRRRPKTLKRRALPDPNPPQVQRMHASQFARRSLLPKPLRRKPGPILPRMKFKDGGVVPGQRVVVHLPGGRGTVEVEPCEDGVEVSAFLNGYYNTAVLSQTSNVFRVVAVPDRAAKRHHQRLKTGS